MASIFTLFSAKVSCTTDAQFDWLMARLGQIADDEIQCCLFERQDDGVWLYAKDEIGDPGGVADIICEFQLQFHLMLPWWMTWATTSQRPITDGFSGGAIVCHRGESHFVEAGLWARETEERLRSIQQLVLLKPLSREQMILRMSEDHYVTAVVHVDLSEVIDRDLADFVALLSARLTGDAMLADVNYAVVGQSGGTLHIEVSGDVSFYLDDD